MAESGSLEDLRFPVGPLDLDSPISANDGARFIDEIAATPARLRAAVSGLDAHQMATPYREGGWTVRQVVHHLPESHLQAYARTKLALTEENPIIKPYDEAKWAELPDVEQTPAEVSLALLESLHTRWVILLRSLSSAQLQRAFFHPEHGRLITVERLIAMYAWHGRHHLAHINNLRSRNGW